MLNLRKLTLAGDFLWVIVNLGNLGLPGFIFKFPSIYFLGYLLFGNDGRDLGIIVLIFLNFLFSRISQIFNLS